MRMLFHCCGSEWVAIILVFQKWREQRGSIRLLIMNSWEKSSKGTYLESNVWTKAWYLIHAYVDVLSRMKWQGNTWIILYCCPIFIVLVHQLHLQDWLNMDQTVTKCIVVCKLKAKQQKSVWTLTMKMCVLLVGWEITINSLDFIWWTSYHFFF